jgi:hypothetical protein
MVLPAILSPFVEGAPAAVMTRIALDWIIEGTPLDQLFREVAEGQYQREFALSHLVQVMVDVACGFRPSPRAAFLRREFERVASISAFYRKLGRMELADRVPVHRMFRCRRGPRKPRPKRGRVTDSITSPTRGCSTEPVCLERRRVGAEVPAEQATELHKPSSSRG